MLRHRIPGTIAWALKELPQTLDETYERILSGIDKDVRGYAHCLFQCLCVSFRPLRLAELAEVLSISFDSRNVSENHIDWRSEDSQQALLSACSSLLTVVNIDGSPVVQFAHFSVREYLMSGRLANAGERHSHYHVLPHLSHSILAQASLSTLLSLDGHIDARAVEQDHPLAIYGALHWVDHAKFGRVSLDIQDLMECLFDRNKPYFAAWIWIYDFDHPFGGQMPTTHPEQPEASPLYYAALCGFLNIVESLARTHPGDVNATGGFYVTPLNAALAKRDLDVAQVLFEGGVNVNAQDDLGLSPLHRACWDDNYNTVKWLLDHQADVNIALTYETCGTPLFFAADRGELNICRLLVENGADIKAQGPLQTASQGGHSDVVKFLLDSGASIDFCWEGGTALTLASRSGYAEVVHILIKRGADVASRDDDQHTALHMASKNGYLESVKALLDNGADPNAEDNYLETPLHPAARGGYLDIVELLFQHGSALDKASGHKETPLHHASRSGMLEVASFLIDHGADVNVEDAGLSSPLHHASANGHLEVAELLVEHGADIDKQTSSQETPLHRASGNGRLEVAHFLIKCGSNVGSTDRDGRTSLHAAAQGGHLDVVELLLESGADVNVRDGDDESSFDLAARIGKVKVARFLAKEMGFASIKAFFYRANPDIAEGASSESNEDNGGEMTLHVASARGRLAVIHSLLDRGMMSTLGTWTAKPHCTWHP